jgi:hypothetical protein
LVQRDGVSKVPPKLHPTLTERERCAHNRKVYRAERREQAWLLAHAALTPTEKTEERAKPPRFTRRQAAQLGLPDYIGPVGYVNAAITKKLGADRPVIVRPVGLAPINQQWTPKTFAKTGETEPVNPAAWLGRRGGQVRSEKKAAASRDNGRKGGRPPLHGPQCDRLPEELRTPACRRARRRQMREADKRGLVPHFPGQPTRRKGHPPLTGATPPETASNRARGGRVRKRSR